MRPLAWSLYPEDEGHGDVGPSPSAVTVALVPGDRDLDTAHRYGLTTREREVLRHLAQGVSNREIAAALSISEATVRSHVSNILEKLGVDGRLQAASKALREGLV